MKLAHIVTTAAAVLAAGAMVSAPALAALTSDAAAAVGGAPLYLPASPSDPGGLKGHDHGSQFDTDIEAHVHGKNKAAQDKQAKKALKKAVAGPKVKAGSYTLAPAPGAEKD